MTVASENEFPKVIFVEGAAPATPDAGEVKVYAKADGLMYSKDDAGTETLMSGGTGSGGVTVEDEGTPLSTTADTLDFVGAGVTATGTGTTKTITIPGGSGGGFPLDSYTIDGTYGDHFTGASLAGIWTARTFTSADETYQVGKDATYLRIAQATRGSAGTGYYQTAPSGDWTFAMAYIPRWYLQNPPAWGIGVVDSSGTGVCTFMYSNPAGLLLGQVTTYSTYGGAFVQSGSSTGSSTLPAAYWINDRKVWIYLRKSGTNYYMAYSLDGEMWTKESTALAWAGTVDRVAMLNGPLGIITSGVGDGSFAEVDWFNKIA